MHFSKSSFAGSYLFYILDLMARPSLGAFELVVMVSVGALDEAYSASVRLEVSRRLEREASLGAVYTTLQRLEAKRLVTSWSSDPTGRRGGRSKRLYRVTSPGMRALRTARALHARMWTGMGETSGTP